MYRILYNECENMRDGVVRVVELLPGIYGVSMFDVLLAS